MNENERIFDEQLNLQYVLESQDRLYYEYINLLRNLEHDKKNLENQLMHINIKIQDNFNKLINDEAPDEDPSEIIPYYNYLNDELRFIDEYIKKVKKEYKVKMKKSNKSIKHLEGGKRKRKRTNKKTRKKIVKKVN